MWERGLITQKSLFPSVPRRSLLYEGGHTLLSVPCGDDLTREGAKVTAGRRAADDDAVTADSLRGIPLSITAELFPVIFNTHFWGGVPMHRNETSFLLFYNLS